MAYKVIARKWRPNTFGEVVGQQAVTQTLRNAIASGRLAQTFVFAGARGVGKTTTARILARALNCESGPTGDPCGTCAACVDITNGRDIDVLEIDAATNTQIDKIREVIISGLAITPVRDRYKVYIIDEVHQLSTASFNALLKSIEEPPPHVVFVMATTELDKIPDTVLSRSQVYEFRTIGTPQIAGQLRKICDAEGISVPDDALRLIARDADGSMRDAQSKLDQVFAFTGETITVDDVGAVLGLVGRDMLLDSLQAVADEDAAAAFTLTARAVELGYDLRLVCRELARVVRDLLVLSVDPQRATDPEIAADGERERLLALVSRYSREDLLRAFDLLSKAEFDIKTAAQPRYHLEMAFLRWMHLRKLVPIEQMIQAASSGGGAVRSTVAPAAASAATAARPSAPPPARPQRPAPSAVPPAAPSARPAAPVATHAPADATGPVSPVSGLALRDALLQAIKQQNPIAYNTLFAQAQRIDVSDDAVVLTMKAGSSSKSAFGKYQGTIEALAAKLAGRKMTVSVSVADDAAAAASAQRADALKQEVADDPNVRALLEVFPAQIRDVQDV